MQPTNAPPPSTGQQQAAGWPPGSGGYAGQQQSAGKVLKKGRPGLIILFSLLAELVFIAAGANQGVTDYVTRHTVQTSNKFVVQLAYAGLTYRWRFSAQNSLASSEHVLVGQFALIGVVLVVTALLVLAIARGAVTFGRVFFGTWMSVIVATQLGAIARGFIIEEQYGGGASGVTRATFAFFGGLAPTGSTFLGSVGLGLLVALVAAIVAVSSRRQAGIVVPQSAAPNEPDQLAQPPEPGFFARADQENQAEQTRQFGAPPWAGGREPQGGAATGPVGGDRPNLTKRADDDQGAGATAAYPVVGSARPAAPVATEQSGPGDDLDFDDEHGRDHDPRPTTAGDAGTRDAAQRSESDWQATTQSPRESPGQSPRQSQSQSQWSPPTQRDTRSSAAAQPASGTQQDASPTRGDQATDPAATDPAATDPAATDPHAPDPNATTQLPAVGPAADPGATTELPAVRPSADESPEDRDSR